MLRRGNLDLVARRTRLQSVYDRAYDIVHRENLAFDADTTRLQTAEFQQVGSEAVESPALIDDALQQGLRGLAIETTAKFNQARGRRADGGERRPQIMAYR